MGQSGRKRARRASPFLGGQGGFLTASTVMAAVGVAWGLYDSLKAAPPAAAGAPVPPPSRRPRRAAGAPAAVARVVRLAVSAARADGTLADAERAAILRHAREAGIAEHVDAELAQPRPLSGIVAGVTAEAARRDLYILAFTIVRADETVSGAERIYLAQLAHALGLDPAAAAALEQQTAAAIDGPAHHTADAVGWVARRAGRTARRVAARGRAPYTTEQRSSDARRTAVVHGDRRPPGGAGEPGGDPGQPPERQHRQGHAGVHLGDVELAAAEGRAGLLAVRRRAGRGRRRPAATFGARAAAPTTSTSPSTATRCSSSKSSSIRARRPSPKPGR